MPARQRRYEIEEIARQGTQLYEQQIRPQVEAGNHGRIVSIDIETGAFEVADTGLEASTRLIARNPEAEIWAVRIGFTYVRRFGYLKRCSAGVSHIERQRR